MDGWLDGWMDGYMDGLMTTITLVHVVSGITSAKPNGLKMEAYRKEHGCIMQNRECFMENDL